MLQEESFPGQLLWDCVFSRVQAIPILLQAFFGFLSQPPVAGKALCSTSVSFARSILILILAMVPVDWPALFH